MSNITDEDLVRYRPFQNWGRAIEKDTYYTVWTDWSHPHIVHNLPINTPVFSVQTMSTPLYLPPVLPAPGTEEKK